MAAKRDMTAALVLTDQDLKAARRDNTRKLQYRIAEVALLLNGKGFELLKAEGVNVSPPRQLSHVDGHRVICAAYDEQPIR